MGKRLAGVGRFFLLFFAGHLALTTGFWAALGKLPADTMPVVGGLFGILMTPALHAAQRGGGSPVVSVSASILNSLAMAGIASMVYALVRKLRAA